MTHGKEDDQILGSDQHTVKLKDIYELLSPLNFPAMAGKPKIIVIQACSGCMMINSPVYFTCICAEKLILIITDSGGLLFVHIAIR